MSHARIFRYVKTSPEIIRLAVGWMSVIRFRCGTLRICRTDGASMSRMRRCGSGGPGSAPSSQPGRDDAEFAAPPLASRRGLREDHDSNPGRIASCNPIAVKHDLWLAVGHEGIIRCRVESPECHRQTRGWPLAGQSRREFAALHGSIHNHFNHERHFSSRPTFKERRAAARNEWRQLRAASSMSGQGTFRDFRVCLKAPLAGRGGRWRQSGPLIRQGLSTVPLMWSIASRGNFLRYASHQSGR